MNKTLAAVLCVATIPLHAGATSVDVLRTFEPPMPASRFAETRLARGGDAVWLINNASLERWTIGEGRYRGDGVWRLPSAPGPSQVLRLAPVDHERAWLLDTTERRAWLLHSGKWSKSIQLPDAVGDAAAQPSGALVINTPMHSAHAFAIVDANGSILKRFGGRLPFAIAQQDALMNSWKLAPLPGGEIVAAHAYLPLLRIYASNGQQKLERTVTIAPVARLEEQRRAIESLIDVKGEECCTSSNVIHFATAVATNGSQIAIRYGLDPQLEILRTTAPGVRASVCMCETTVSAG